jgi:phosphomannomutase
MQLDTSIFKAYDIRGVTPTTINEEVAFALGKAFGAAALAAKEKAVAVGRDGRLSGPALAAALIRGLAASGVDVIDVGMVTTPVSRSPAATTRRTTTVSKWCWRAGRFLVMRFRV